MRKTTKQPSGASKTVILALNAESIYAIHWLVGYLREKARIIVISPYDIKKNHHFSQLRKNIPKSDSTLLYQITSEYGYFSKITILRYLKSYVHFYSLKRNYPDGIFHTHYLRHFALFGLMLKPKNLIISPYGSDLFSISFLRKIILKLLLRRAKLLNPHSKYMADHLITVYRIPEEKMVTAHLGVDLQRWKKPSRENLVDLRTRMKIPKKNIVFLSYRRLGPIYQIHLLPQIHSLLLHQNIPAHFIYVVGAVKTNYSRHFENLIKEKQLSEYSTIIKYVMTSEELAELLNLSDYFFSIPKWDQVAATVQEGMYCECIPILSDLNVYREVVNEHTAIFIPTDSTNNMAIEIGSKVKSDMHLNNKIKNLNKNIIMTNYNMKVNLSKIIKEIFKTNR